MIRIQIKRLLAADLGVEVPPGVEMTKANFIESSWRSRR